jgi:outer membrane receptor protein involved in Fe transport
VNLSYEPDADLTVYSTVSKGFRPGGANQILPPQTQPPHCEPGALQFAPDSVWNYEVGEKGRLFDNWLTINSDVYYIKWNNIQQVITLPCGHQYYNNAGDGRSFGPELEVNCSFVGSSYDVAYYFGYKLPSYSLVNARVGIGQRAWTATLFCDNLTNKVALITANDTSFQFNIPQLVRYSTNQPRAAGVQVDYKFFLGANDP